MNIYIWCTIYTIILWCKLYTKNPIYSLHLQLQKFIMYLAIWFLLFFPLQIFVSKKRYATKLITFSYLLDLLMVHWLLFWSPNARFLFCIVIAIV